MPSRPFTVGFEPGIKRDGTRLEGNQWVDGQWVRFYRGRPRKIGGYREVEAQLPEVSRGVYVHKRNKINHVFSGGASKLVVFRTDDNVVGAGTVDRTPAGFATNAEYSWSMDAMFDVAGSSKAVLIAHAGANLLDPSSTVSTPVYYGDAEANTALVTTGESVSGGAVVLSPYLVLYGTDGLVKNSDINSPANFATGDANTANVTHSKIIKGLPLRGGGSSPAGLLWSLDSLIRMSYTGGGAVFRFDTLSSQSSIISPASVVEYYGAYFWMGLENFFVFSGGMQELPNSTNLQWLLDNLNWTHRGKIWATTIPRFAEIWWFVPMGTSTECNHAIIYNVREKCWYDAAISRSAGFKSSVLRYPVWADPNVNRNSKYSMWAHEFGYNKIEGDTEIAVATAIESPNFGLPTGGPGGEAQAQGVDSWIRLTRMEPDFGNQYSQMSMTVLGQEYANSPDTISDPFPFDSTTEKVDVREQRRHMRVRFECAGVNSTLQQGNVLLHVEEGDRRQ